MDVKKKVIFILFLVVGCIVLHVSKVTAQNDEEKTYTGDSANDDKSEDFESE